MNILVFGKINTYCLLLANENNHRLCLDDIISNPVFVPISLLGTLNSKQSYSSAKLKTILGNRVELVSKAYYFIENSKHFLFISTSSIFDYRKLGIGLELARKQANLIDVGFRYEMRKKLVCELFDEKATVFDCLKAFSKYIFCERYSLWLYNKVTKTFTCSYTSKKSSKGYIKKSEGTSLNHILDKNYTNECREPEKESIKSFELDGYKSINRIKINLGEDDQVGVINFYSKLEDFCIKNELQAQIKNIIETKYREHFQCSNEQFNKIINYFVEEYKLDYDESFFQGMTPLICESLLFESCSIFLYSDKTKSLHLKSIKDQLHFGEPSEEVEYDLKKTCLTTGVFNERIAKWSYNLDDEPENSKQLVEDASMGNKNWIGVPIFDKNDNKSYGVLRVKNKYHVVNGGKRVIANFKSIDFSYLETICEYLVSILKIDIAHKNTVDSYIDLQEREKEKSYFDTVFLHEVRTPISTFSSSPERISHEIDLLGIDKEKVESIKNKLLDIKTLAHRLRFITNTYYFEKIVTSRNYENITVLRDIVFPVLNITKWYLSKQFDLEVNVDHDRLMAIPVYGDKTLLNIVFNALLDNAGKYSNLGGKSIHITGAYSTRHKYYDLSVSNWGMEINNEEKALVFERGKRGDEARKRTEGTGIGLHLGRRIMREHNGDLFISSRKNPVTLVMRIPTSKEVLSKNV